MFLVLLGGGVLGCSACPTGNPALLPPVASDGEAFYPSTDKAAADSLAASLGTLSEPIPAGSRPLEVLAVSGGIAGAPFTAGVLVGWTQSGTRPTFDQVTGISSGALIGAYAFLGPKYDPNLQQLVLRLGTSDLIKLRPLPSLIRDGAFGSAEPTERLIRTEINDCFLADLRQAHAEGRRFFVGTMNMETKQLVTWDVGAIASSGRPDADDLVRKLLLAAVSWPGLVPPVEFDVELNGHVCREQQCDGGSACMAFVRFGPQPGWPEPDAPPRPGWLAGSNLYVLTSRKLYCDPAPVPRRALARVMASTAAIFEALTRADLWRLYSFCAASGMRFHLLAVPQDHQAEPQSMAALYPREARQLFEAGYQRGGSGSPWRRSPPGVEPGEEAIPRDGSHILIGR
jgi:hypothetical protein